MRKILQLIGLLFIVSCNTLNSENVLYPGSMSFVENSPIIDNYGKTVLERIDAPFGYTRVSVSQNTFEEYLRSLPLKPSGSVVHYFDGKVKQNQNIYTCVVDMPISSKNVQTSTGSIMRLISEYFFRQGEYSKIVFHEGKERIDFMNFAKGDYSKNKFDEYLDFVMSKVSTPSFCSDLSKVKLNQIQIGDVFVQNLDPNGHAVIVVDMVQNRNGEKLFLLAQGFQPAQEIQILVNPKNEEISPWYTLEEGELLTPEWRFMTSDLMRFKLLED